VGVFPVHTVSSEYTSRDYILLMSTQCLNLYTIETDLLDKIRSHE